MYRSQKESFSKSFQHQPIFLFSVLCSFYSLSHSPNTLLFAHPLTPSPRICPLQSLSFSFFLAQLTFAKRRAFSAHNCWADTTWNYERRESVIERDCCTRDTREDRFSRKTQTRTDSFQLVLILKLESFSTDMILTPPALAFTLNYAFLGPSLFFIPCKPRFPPSNPSL